MNNAFRLFAFYALITKWYIVNDQMVNELIFDIFGHLPDCVAIIPPNVGGRCFAHFCKADA